MFIRVHRDYTHSGFLFVVEFCSTVITVDALDRSWFMALLNFRLARETSKTYLSRVTTCNRNHHKRA